MASLPPQRPAAQRRPSPPAEPSPAAQEAHTERRSSYSAASVDSQTLVLNSAPSQSAKPSEPTRTEATAQPTQPDDAEPRKCWICFNDETEDDEFSSEWRSPCPCVLVAHEKCLLDWIADMEAPNTRRRTGANAGKILCPQCKSEIRLQRPRNLIVDLVHAMERAASMTLLPGFFLVTATATYTTLYMTGVGAIFSVFGPEDALRILDVRQRREAGQIWKIALGVPLIPAALVASRTSAADSFIPFLPLIFFAGGGKAQRHPLQLSWPPSAAFTIAVLPYVRAIYNAYYERVWLPREQRWLKEIQPRAGTEDAANDGNAENPHVHGEEIFEVIDEELEDGDQVVEIEVDFDIFADWNNGGAADNNNALENPPVPIARGPGALVGAPQQGHNAAPAAPVGMQDGNAEAAPAPNVPRQPVQPRRQRIRRERNMGFSTTSLADTILGALIFPSIAAAVGKMLNKVLPRSWVTPPVEGKPTGFLQTRWGRSIAGGCLFVGLKDALFLYVRWKMAQNHRHRTILDYDKSKAKKKAAKT